MDLQFPVPLLRSADQRRLAAACLLAASPIKCCQSIHQIQLDLVDTLAAFYGGSSQQAGGGKAPLIRTAEERDGKLQVHCPVCNQKSDITRDQLGEVITCPQEGCEAKLKLNTFTIQMD